MRARVLHASLVCLFLFGCTALPDRPVYRQSHYLKAQAPNEGAKFGWASAMSADGQTLVVGVTDEPTNRSEVVRAATGMVHVYQLHDGVWLIDAELRPGNANPQEWFGYAVAISADGQTIAVGAVGDGNSALNVHSNEVANTDAKPNSGAVYVYERVADGWSRVAFVKASNPDPEDFFGASVALSGDGSVLAVGAPGEANASNSIGFQLDIGDVVPESQTDNSAAESGAVYIFENATSGWSPEYYIKGAYTIGNHRFGSAVALSADGTTLAVGTPQDDSGARGVDSPSTVVLAPNSGSVYTFRYADYFWTQESYVKATDALTNDRFGTSLSISADGNTLLVGAPGRSSPPGDALGEDLNAHGTAYVFAFVDAHWRQDAYLVASNADTGDRFGAAVALSPDGSTAVVGAAGESSSSQGVNGDPNNNDAASSGAVYAFNRARRGWDQEAYIKPLFGDAGDAFGTSVATSLDGTSILAGAHRESSSSPGVDGNGANNSLMLSGAAYLFQR